MTKKENNKQQGGGLFDFLSGETSKSKPVLRAKQSEDRLISSYESYIYSKKYYENIYDKHLENLTTLDELSKMGNSLVTLFKDNIYTPYIAEEKSIDTTNSLLLRNYLFTVTKEEPRLANFRKDHIIAQIQNVLNNYHSNDRKIFSDYDIAIDGGKVDITFILQNGVREGKKIDINSNYIINEKQLVKAIENILDIHKGNITKGRKPYENKDDFIVKEEELNIPGFNNSVVTDKNKLTKLLTGKNNNTEKKSLVARALSKKNSNTGKKEYKPKKIEKKKTQRNTTEEFLKKVKGPEYNKEKERVATGVEKPLTKKQILDFQHQQVLPVEEEKNELGRDVFGIVNSTEELRKLLGLTENKSKPGAKTIYNDIPLEKLKKLDLSQVTDKAELDKICNRFSEDEDTCKKMDQCWYNAKSDPKCYRFKQKDEV